jgi:hypothetical protein
MNQKANYLLMDKGSIGLANSRNEILVASGKEVEFEEFNHKIDVPLLKP